MSEQQGVREAVATFILSFTFGILGFVFFASRGQGLIAALVAFIYIINVAIYFAADILSSTPEAFEDFPKTDPILTIMYAVIPLYAAFSLMYLAYGTVLGVYSNFRQKN